MQAPPIDYESVFIARQPVFRPDESVWGYELLFRTGEENAAIISDQSQATASVIADGLSMALQGLPNDLRILINFPEQMLIDDVGFALPRENCIVEVLEDVHPTPEVLAAITRLKEAGYTIAVDDYFGQEELWPVIKLADIIKIDILELKNDPERIERSIQNIPTENVMLLAEKVENNETFNNLKEMGFSLFQGFFFSKPEIIPGKKLTSNELTKLQLLAELSKQDLEPAQLASILQSDPNLSYRLFRYINSVNFGLRSKVSSLKRAIDMMGLIQTKHWLRTALLADINTSPRAGELALFSVQRAKFLESLCSLTGSVACYPDSMFIIGLFSLLDVMLGMEMDDILTHLPLDDVIREALTGKGDVQTTLDLIHCYERGDWDNTCSYLQDMNLSTKEVDKLYAESRTWAQQILGFSQVDPADDG